MINVSNEFKQLMGRRTDFKENAEITFSNGTVLELKENDFTVSNNGITDAAETNGIPLGVAVGRSIQIELMNDDDRFSGYDFFGAKIHLYLTFQLSETVEKIEYGTFTVLTPETYGTTVIITALDDMYKADTDYTTSLVFPATIGVMLRDACNTLDISQGTVTFLNDDFIVEDAPTDITFRQLFGYIAMIAGGNARIDVTGRMRIISYNFGAIEDIRNNIDGGSFMPWNNPVDLDGGDFTYNTGDVADGGTFTDAINYHILTNWKSVKVDTDDVVITGISTSYTDEENEDHTVIYGVEGYVLKITNPLIAGKEQDAVALIGNVMVGGRFRQFSGDLIANPTCEFMDVAAIVDRKNNVYLSFLTDINFQFFSFTTLKNSAEPALRNSAKAYSDATQALVAARKLIKNERTAREQAVAQLAKDLQNSSGLFMTQEKQSDGSIIYYMHDKPTLEESMIVWKLTALAFGISTDGGKTYPYGFTVNGEAIVKLLYAEGIDVENLVVGENVLMGDKAVISWMNVSNKPSDLAYVKDIPTTEQITKITKNTVTTSYVNALNVTAKSVAAEDITGEQISGKKFVSNVAIGTYNTQTTIDGGTITAKVTDNSIKTVIDYNGLTTSYDNKAFSKITPNSFSIYSNTSSSNVEILQNRILVEYTPLMYTEIGSSSFMQRIAQNNYTKIEGATILSYNGETLQTQITPGSINFKGNGQIKYNGSECIQVALNTVKLKPSYVYIGSTAGSIGFFGDSKSSAKKSVSTITATSSATASTCATKINELINALKAYNLIG